ncbi:hypothetical protein HDK90DRAFT_57466 [Phyllosticta capitalensis]|uniref:Secreted protein n=1 Tax=Phyllosticta capitalensis TaxID=121624 RepID=A0ABR1YEH1_9PEZI
MLMACAALHCTWAAAAAGGGRTSTGMVTLAQDFADWIHTCVDMMVSQKCNSIQHNSTLPAQKKRETYKRNGGWVLHVTVLLG